MRLAPIFNRWYSREPRPKKTACVALCVHGPIVRQLGINAGTNCLGPGNRANASIGRALHIVTGIEAVAEPMDAETYFSDLADGACKAICRAGWFADYPTYDNFMYDLFHTDSLGGNNYGYSNPKFDQLVDQWIPLTLLLNSLNRSLGQDDAYPFALTSGALQKLRFVHDVIQAQPPGALSRP